MGGKAWTTKEVATLEQLWPDWEALRQALDRSDAAIGCRSRAMGLDPGRLRWSLDETNLILRYWPQGGYQAVRAHLPHRSKAAVRAKAVKLGLLVEGAPQKPKRPERHGPRETPCRN